MTHICYTIAPHTQLESIKQDLENPAMQYPDYYLKDFHSYDEGNLNWLAAMVCGSARGMMRIWMYSVCDTCMCVMLACMHSYQTPSPNPHQ